MTFLPLIFPLFWLAYATAFIVIMHNEWRKSPMVLRCVHFTLVLYYSWAFIRDIWSFKP